MMGFWRRRRRKREAERIDIFVRVYAELPPEGQAELAWMVKCGFLRL